uniref:CXXC-type zinc finger protein 1 n=1 Tax=Meloidogyne incognita TaxID=6306 RepID=A0A914LI85_MELIC
MADLKTSRKGKPKNEDDFIDDEEEDTDDEEVEERHCICDSRDYSTLMICCDYCSIWYHTKCVGIKKKDVERIEKFACRSCKKKGNEIVYKKENVKTSKKRKESTEEQENNKKSKIEIKPVKIIKKEESTVRTLARSPSLANSTLAKVKVELANIEPKEISNSLLAIKIKEEPSSNISSSNIPINDHQKPLPPPITIIDVIKPPSSSPAPLQLIPPTILKQQKIQEENPELRCENCIGCFRDEDCGKCVVCMQSQNKGKLCMQRICVQVEELFKKKLKKSEKALSETSSIDCEVHVSTRGRKPKQQSNDETITKHRRSVGMSEKPKENDDLALQLNKFYNNLMRKRTKARNNNELPIEHEEKQCIGPECTNSVRQGSKYCSERCGLALAQIRLKTILPQRFNDFFAKVPSKQIEDNKKLDNVEGQITLIHQKLKKFGEWKDNVENFLEAIKNAQPNAERPKSGDDNFVVGCPVCGGEFPMRESTKHIQSCYTRSEKQTTYGTDYPIPTNQYKLYCDSYNKINKTYCKRLRYACAEHYRDEFNLKICGCPLIWYKNGSCLNFESLFISSDAMIADGGYCQEKNKNCRAHQNWIQTAFSLIDNERMNLLNQLEELIEQRGFILKTLTERGDVLTLLCSQSQRLNIEKEDKKEEEDNVSSGERTDLGKTD